VEATGRGCGCWGEYNDALAGSDTSVALVKWSSHANETLKSRFYEVKRLKCPKCHGVFNQYYQGTSLRGKKSESVIGLSLKASRHKNLDWWP
jgi:hypothetical protein